MEKPPGSFGDASDAKPETAPKEMPKFGSTATFGSAPLAFGGSPFGKPAGSGFFNIAPSFGNSAPVFPPFLKLSTESTERPKSPPKSTAEPAAPAPKAPTSLDFFSSTTTSITFNMPKFQWGQGPSASQTTAATTNSLFGVNPEKPSTVTEKKEEEEDGEGDEGADAEQPHSPPQVYTTTPITRPTEPIMTGEENEVHVHQVNKAKLYRLDKDEARTFWKEKGVGQVRINRSRESPHESRILMRMDGAFKLMLNSKIFPTMPARLVGENSVALSALSDEGGSSKVELCNFLIKVQGRAEAELLLGAIEVQKQKAAEAPEDEAREKGTSKRGADDGAAKKEERGKAKSPAKSPGKAQEAAKKARRRSEEATEKEPRDGGDKEEPRGGNDKEEGGDAEAGRAAKGSDSE